MPRQLTVDGSDILATTRQQTIHLVSEAFRGEIGTGGWDRDDDAAAITMPGLKVVRLTEDASGLIKHLFRGRMGIKDLHRGDHVIGNARQYQVNVSDSNWDLRKLRVHAWSRPAETGRARVVALGAYILNGSSSTVTNATKRATTVIDVATYVPNTNTVTMPVRVYDATDPFAVLDDCARAEGKEWFVIIDDAAGAMYLWFDLPTSTSYASTVSITDSSPDYSTSFPPIIEGTAATQDPSELLSGGALINIDGVAVTEARAGVATSFDVAEDTVYDSGAGSGDAATRLTKLLDDRDDEEVRYRCAVQLTPAQAHLIKAGMTLSFRSAAAGVTSPITLRVVNCGLEIKAPEKYLLHLELNYPDKVKPRIQSHGQGTIATKTTAAPQATFSLGADISLEGWQLQENDTIFGTWIGPLGNNGIISGVDLVNFVNLGCGSSDLWWGQRVYYAGIRTQFALPANNNYLGLELGLNLNCEAFATGLRGGASGGISPIKGPHLVTAGFIGNTLLVGDVNGGVAVAVLWGNASVKTGIKIFLPSGLCPWGSGTRFIMQPQFRAKILQLCDVTGLAEDLAAGLGEARPRDGYLKPITIATPGWLTGGIIGTQDGINASFTLVGGWGDVESVTVNNLTIPLDEVDLSAGTPNIAFKGWAPQPTDTVLVRYRSL